MKDHLLVRIPHLVVVHHKEPGTHAHSVARGVLIAHLDEAWIATTLVAQGGAVEPTVPRRRACAVR